MGEVGVQTDLAAWLLACVHADRTVAEDALRDWVDGEDGDVMAEQPDSILIGAHLVRWNPRRVLAECDTKRRIIELHGELGHAPCDAHDSGLRSEHCETLRLLVPPYVARDGYRAEWAPDGR